MLRRSISIQDKENVKRHRSNFYINYFPLSIMDIDDIIQEIFIYLSFDNLSICAAVNRKWNRHSDDDDLRRLKIYQDRAFNPFDWKNHLGLKVEEEDKIAYSLIPRNIWKIFKRPCSFIPNKKWGESNFLFWIPDVCLTLNIYLSLLKSPAHSKSLKCWSEIMAVYGNKYLGYSGWVIISINPIVDIHNSEYDIPYLLEAIIGFFSMYFKLKIQSSTFCYIKCEEEIRGNPVLLKRYESDSKYTTRMNILYNIQNILDKDVDTIGVRYP